MEECRKEVISVAFLLEVCVLCLLIVLIDCAFERMVTRAFSSGVAFYAIGGGDQSLRDHCDTCFLFEGGAECCHSRRSPMFFETLGNAFSRLCS